MILLLSLVFANFSGSWYGQGTMTSSSATIPCEFEFKITETETLIEVNHQWMGCSEIAFRWPIYAANKINGELYNTKTGIYGGTISDKEIHVNYLMSPESAPYIINATKISHSEVDFEMILEGTDDKKYFRAPMKLQN